MGTYVSLTIEQFAGAYKVKTGRDECGDVVIPGRKLSAQRGSHIFDGYVDGRLGVCLMLGSPRKWTTARRKLLAAGFTIKQDGQTEGIATFDPAERTQSRLAIKLAGVKTRRMAQAPSPAQVAAREAFARTHSARPRELSVA